MMTTNSDNRQPLRLDIRLLTAGAVLTGVGGLLGFAGLAAGSAAVVGVARQWLRQLDQPPNEIAKQRWQQLMSAAAAGNDAWRNPPPAQSSAS